MGEKMNINYIESPLIEIKSDNGFLLDLKYCKKYKNSIDKCYVRKEVYDKLLSYSQVMGECCEHWSKKKESEVDK